MEKTKYLFDLSQKYGGDWTDGQRNFLLDSFKVLIEDDDFFNDTIGIIDQGVYVEYFGLFAGVVKDIYNLTGVKPSVDVIRVWIGKKFKDYTAEELYAFVDEICKRELSDERIQEIKATFKFYNLWSYYVSLGNHIIQSASDGFPTPNKLMKKIEEALDASKILSNAYNSFKEKYNNDGSEKTSADDW